MKILLIQTSFLGDTILSTPVIKGIKKLYPDSEIWMLTTILSAQLLKHDPLLKGIITFDKKALDKGIYGLFRKAKEIKSHNFDKVFSLHKSYRTALLVFLCRLKDSTGFRQAALSFFYNKRVVRDTGSHDAIRNLSLLSEEPDFLQSGLRVEKYFDTDLRLFSGSMENSKFNGILKQEKPFAVLAVGSNWKTKMWKWQGYKEVAMYLNSRGFLVVFVGSGDEYEISEKASEGAEAINLAGKTTLDETIAIMKHAKLVVCNDSMATHMASALKVPNVVIFCATGPEFGFGPWNNRNRIVQKEGLDCKPCRRHGSNACPTGTEACMNDLEAAKVIAAIDELLV